MAHRGGAIGAWTRRKELTPAGRKLLEEIDRMANTSETLSEEILARVSALPPSDQAELVSILGVRAHEAGVWEEEHIQHSDLVRSAAETIREAQEHELAAGRRVNPYLMLREALEILRR